MSKILVLGGGIVGLSTAMMLTRRGHDVTRHRRKRVERDAASMDQRLLHVGQMDAGG